MRELVRNPYLLKVVVEVYQTQNKLPQTRGELFREFGRYLLGWGLRRQSSGQLLQELLPEQRTTDLTLDSLDPGIRQGVIERLVRLVELLLGELAFAMFADQTQGTEANLKWAFGVLPDTVSYSFEYLYDDDFQIAQLEQKRGKIIKLARQGV